MNNLSTITNLQYTYQYSKYSCSVTFYFLHVIAAYLVCISGLFCFITRLHQKIKFLHAWSGRFYILAMLYATATSLLIHNTGLPFAILISFLYVLVGMTIGWLLIKIHQIKIFNQVLNNLNEKMKHKYINDTINLKDDINKELEFISNNKSWKDRFFSLKTFHGLFMFLSWLNITGRIFASDQSGDFTCYTYPIYKPEFTNFTQGDLELVPVENPNYDRLPWGNDELGWSMYLFFGPLIFGLIFGLIWSNVATKCNTKK